MTGIASAVAIGAVATVAGAAISAHGAESAAQTQANAAQNASNTQLQMFNTIQGNEAPWTQVGGQANSALAQFYGLPGASSAGGSGYTPTAGGGVARSLTPGVTGSSSSPDYNAILSNLPGYQFQLQQGSQAAQRNLAAMGLLNSGAAGKALTQYGQGLAQNYAGQYTAGLSGLSQLGQAGAAGVATAGMNTANQVGANQIYAGNAGASGIVGQTNAINSGLQGLVSSYGQYNQANAAQQQYLQGQSNQIDSLYGNPQYTPPANYLDMNLGGP